MNLWKDLKSGPDLPEIVYAVIEIPKGSNNKYEYDKEIESFILDRVLFSPMFYPGEYGLIPNTLWDDGDPMDILVITNQPTFTGCIIETKVIGVLKMIDSGESDYKIIGVPVNDPNYKNVEDIFDIEESFLNKIVHFFKEYKTLEDKKTEILGWGNKDEAYSYVEDSIKLFTKMNNL